MKKRGGDKKRGGVSPRAARSKPSPAVEVEREADAERDDEAEADAEMEPVTASGAAPAPAEETPPTGMGWAILVALGLAAALFFLNRAASEDDHGASGPTEEIEVHGRRGRSPSGGGAAEGGSEGAADANEPEALTVRVIRSVPHDPRAFTQGLEYHDGELFEGTGIRRRSSMRRVALETGEVLLSVPLPPEVFGEGITVIGDRIWQISWVEQRAFLRNRADFSVIREVSYEGEGWGLCHDESRIVMSDGSDHLFFRDPDTFELRGSVAVTLRGEPLDQLNELECVEGLVYANVWQTDHIARIDPATGIVTGWIDTSLHRENARGARLLDPADAEDADVLNGIAWMPDRGHFLIGGKEWPRSFEVDFVPAE